ncbi:MAG TPA: NADH-quinone oxidoreductase subunit N [Bacteroidales bacterium]|nr:NADH-quinone oxidoreductase subunit N [Bacteroidales bacterium]
MFVALAPMYIIAAAIVVLMLLAAFVRNHKLLAIVSALGFIAAFGTVFSHCSCLSKFAWELFVVDDYSWALTAVTLLSALAINIFSYFYFENFDEQKEEYYVLLHTAVLGTLVMIAAKHFVTFFIGLELLSIPTYVMVAYVRSKKESVEASIKYLATAAASSAALLFGLALIYAAAGTMDIYTVGRFFYIAQSVPAYTYVGIALFIVAVGFKLALAPFHMWSPAVYQGSAAPVTAFVASVAKLGVIAFVLRLFNESNLLNIGALNISLVVLAVLSMFIGNLFAVGQKNIKRMLAYSSVAHMGYLMVALLAGGMVAKSATGFYITSYFVATLALFGAISVISKNDEPKSIDSLKGLYYRNPIVAVVITIGLLALIGMPLTGGFMAKVFVVKAGAGIQQWFLVWMLIINSIISIYYYTKYINVLFSHTSEEVVKEKVPYLLATILIIIVVLVIWMGVAPQLWLNLFYN